MYWVMKTMSYLNVILTILKFYVAFLLENTIFKGSKKEARVSHCMKLMGKILLELWILSWKKYGKLVLLPLFTMSETIYTRISTTNTTRSKALTYFLNSTQGAIENVWGNILLDLNFPENSCSEDTITKAHMRSFSIFQSFVPVQHKNKCKNTNRFFNPALNHILRWNWNWGSNLGMFF